MVGSSQSTCQLNLYYMANVKTAINLIYFHNGVKSTYMSSQSILHAQSILHPLNGVKSIYITWPMSNLISICIIPYFMIGSSQSTSQVNLYYMANVKMGIHLENPLLNVGVKSIYMSSQSIFHD